MRVLKQLPMAVLLALAVSAGASAQAFKPDVADKAAAVKEGGLNWYSSTPFPLRIRAGQHGSNPLSSAIRQLLPPCADGATSRRPRGRQRYCTQPDSPSEVSIRAQLPIAWALRTRSPGARS